MMKTVTLQDYKRRMLRVLVHIQGHLDEALSLEELAHLACFSPYHFHRIFRGMVGESVKDHVRRLRLERAAGKLRLSAVPVTQIAFDAGYDSPEAFSRSFRTVFGLSPSQFRTTNRRRRSARAPSGLHFSQGKGVRQFKAVQPGDKKMDIKTLAIEPIRVAFMRHVGPYAEVGATWDKLLAQLGKDGFIGGDSWFIGICHDDPDVTPSAKIRYDACLSVPETFVAEGEIGVQVVAGGEYAVTTHFGPYQKLGETYSRLLGQWLPRSGRVLRCSPCFEVYLNDPQSTAPEELTTDVYAPLEPAGRPLKAPKSATVRSTN